MDKPLSLKINEFKNSISDVVSNAEIPIYILKYLIKDLYEEIDNMVTNISNKEIKDYYESQKETEENAPLEK